MKIVHRFEWNNIKMDSNKNGSNKKWTISISATPDTLNALAFYVAVLLFAFICQDLFLTSFYSVFVLLVLSSSFVGHFDSHLVISS